MGDPVIITHKLLEFGETIDPKELFPVVVPAAAEFTFDNPYAFSMAISLDRQTKADIIWTIPYDIFVYLGHLDPNRFYKMSLDEIANIFSRLPRKPRFVNDAPKTVKDLTQIVVDEFKGDASLIWKDKRAIRVKNTFSRIYGVGPGIANMSVLLIEKAYGIRFSDLDRPGMDIKANVHTMRVLYRLGVSRDRTEQDALDATRHMHPEYPGELDAPLWIIGRKWCNPGYPNCIECPMNGTCQRVGVSF
jgi:endonuclease III